MMKTTQSSISIKLLQTSFFALLFLFSFSIFSQTNVTFSVNTENISVGENGIVTVERSENAETYFKTTKGIKVDRGYSSNLFINNHKKDECKGR